MDGETLMTRLAEEAEKLDVFQKRIDAELGSGARPAISRFIDDNLDLEDTDIVIMALTAKADDEGAETDPLAAKHFFTGLLVGYILMTEKEATF